MRQSRVDLKHINLKAVVGAVLFSLTAFLAFTLPDHPDALGMDAFLRLPLEWPVIAILVLMTRGFLRRLIIYLCALLVFVVLFLKIADIGVQTAFQRQFNPYLDLKMLADGWNLISGTIGTPAALIALTGGVLMVLLVVIIFLNSLRQMAETQASLRRLLIGVFACIIAGAGSLFLIDRTRVELATPTYLTGRFGLVVRSFADMQVFEKQLGAGLGPRDGTGLFQAVKGKDVFLIFVESYGRSAVDDPRYSGVTLPRLSAMETQIEAIGLQAASGWATSPTVGGLSWLAHGTLLSGLWVDSQARYDRLMISRQPSLNRLFLQAGWQTVAVMPAITMAWPEADYFGYNQILSATGLEYRGKPFNWVTMPDQYTLSAFDRLALKPASLRGQNVMAEIALISSHAPWTPVPRLVDWDAVGDGSIFNGQATSGDPPSVVWADPERVRSQYIQTIDYSLATLGDFMARQGKGAVYIILGDHQPASIITGPDASRAVPVHIVTDDAQLLARFQKDGFTSGMTPVNATGERSMSELRQLLIEAFSNAEK
ncbi:MULTISPECIES: sulfatase [unclassified Rhizobium]|uniref:sulfatase n=1 Tax=unclassified Rhizobium TaxID=2613769 RepID=UPI0017821898|nr:MULTISPECIES: sulfatase [unclassified Rhizobium]MBD8688335.1 sulfatase [Rhizobium sp. CFBP 13644]MBD8692790.1 sulfatase [Rhizobium sp. CFBP 13717]